MLKDFLENISKSYKEIKNLPEILHKLDKILTHETWIGEEFEYICSGSYKEAYRLNEDYVIKFAAFYNQTDEEIRLYDLAEEEEVDSIFLPSWFFYLHTGSRPLLTELVPEVSDISYDEAEDHPSDYYIDEYDRIYPRAEYLIIQPYVEYTVCDRKYEHLPHNKLDYEKSPIIDKQTGTAINHEEIKKWYISSKDWIQSILDIYGYEYFSRCGKFLEEYNVTDLHTENIGYLVKNGIEYPVILDCMSEC